MVKGLRLEATIDIEDLILLKIFDVDDWIFFETFDWCISNMMVVPDAYSRRHSMRLKVYIF